MWQLSGRPGHLAEVSSWRSQLGVVVKLQRQQMLLGLSSSLCVLARGALWLGMDRLDELTHSERRRKAGHDSLLGRCRPVRRF